MKILDAGDHPLSNADVLDWIQRKRAQHAAEDAADQAQDRPPPTRPRNFLVALDRTERELSSDRYPYTKNPSVYAGARRLAAFRHFALEAERAVQDHLERAWRARPRPPSRAEVETEFARAQEARCLTAPELLMLFNAAPTCVEMLQPMLEDVEERFSAEEQQLLVEVIGRTLRRDENGTAG